MDRAIKEYFHITRKVFEVDCVIGMNFLFKILDSLLGEFVTGFGIRELHYQPLANLLTNISAIIVINSHNTFPKRN